MNSEEVYKSETHHDFWIADKKLLKTVWTTPMIMPEETYRQEINNFFEVVKKCEPQFVLLDATQANYNVQPETQEWMVTTHFPVYVKIGLKKMAILMSQDIITQLSLEQTIDEGKEANDPFETQYFSQESEAQQWLNQD